MLLILKSWFKLHTMARHTFYHHLIAMQIHYQRSLCLLFLRLVSHACQMSINAMPGQTIVWLELTTSPHNYIASEISHQFVHILCYLEFKRTSIETIWLCLLCIDWKPFHFMASHHHSPYMISCYYWKN